MSISGRGECQEILLAEKLYFHHRLSTGCIQLAHSVHPAEKTLFQCDFFNIP
jgi:hypothetical protein